MKSIHLASIFFSLIMFTGMTATSMALAEPERHPMADQLEEFCAMSETEKEMFFNAYPNVADYNDKLETLCKLETLEERIAYFKEQNDLRREQNSQFGSMEKYCAMSDAEKKSHVEKHNPPPYRLDLANKYCSVDESERHDFIKQHTEKQKDFALRYEMSRTLEKVCQMSPEEQDSHFEEHGKSQEEKNKILSYCTLNEEDKAAFIQKHKDKFAEHMKKINFTKKTSYEMNQYCSMSDEDKSEFLNDRNIPKGLASEVEKYCTMSDNDKAKFLEDRYAEFEKQLKRGEVRNEMYSHMNKYCKMSHEEKSILAEKYEKSEDKIARDE